MFFIFYVANLHEKKLKKKFAEQKKFVSLRPQNHFQFLIFASQMQSTINNRKSRIDDTFFDILEDKVVQGKKCTCQFESVIIFKTTNTQ